MRNLMLLIVALMVLGCVDTSNTVKESGVFDESSPQLIVEDAKGFSIRYTPEYVELKTHSFGVNTPFESIVQLNFSEGNQDGIQKIQRACCQSSTHLAFLNALKEIDCVVGQCGLQYVLNPDYQAALNKNGVEEICQGEQDINEVILNLNPDIYFTYPFGREKDLKATGDIQELLIAEYLETDPVARLEWIKLFGVLFEKEEMADSIFQFKKLAYNQLKNQVSDDHRPTFMMNLPYGDSWHQPSSQSLIVSLIEDAGFNYLYHDSSTTENHTFTLEQAWSDGAKADYWIIIANRETDFTKAKLIAEQAVYESFKSVQENQVVFCNSATSGYFTQGILEPEIMLQELIDIRIQQVGPSNSYFNLLK